MITKWKVYNFKSVRKETELEFAPLTIFAGANSSGKSTFLQSILLVAQTLAHKVSSRSVVLNGAFTKLGQFDDLRSVDSDADQIVIGWACQPIYVPGMGRSGRLGLRRRFPYGRARQFLASVSCEIAFDTEESGLKKEITQIQPRLFSAQISAVTRDPEIGDTPVLMTVRRASPTDDETRRQWIDAYQGDDLVARASLQYVVELDENSLEELHEDLVSAEPIGCQLRHFLPERLSLGVDMVAEDARLISSALAGEGPPGMYTRYYQDREIFVPAAIVDLVLELAERAGGGGRALLEGRIRTNADLFGTTGVPLESLHDALRHLSPRIRTGIRRELGEVDDLEDRVRELIRQERPKEWAVLPFRPPSAVAEASSYLDQFFSSKVRYLGPLRDEPKSLYPLAPTADPLDVGLKGEHTAAVLELHKNKQIRYIPTSAFSQADIDPRAVTRSLEAAVVDWLQYLGVAESVQSQDRGKLGHELKVNVSGNGGSYDLTHVGVGVSQVLPILVASLLAEPDTTLIFEQPEIHLHPKVQTLLADFFLSMTRLGKQCVVETHSEYLINRLRFRTAAAGDSNPWVSALKVYFVERPSEGSVFREVKINEYGAVVDWPEGFFDQSQREAEAILLAAAKKRKRKGRK